MMKSAIAVATALGTCVSAGGALAGTYDFGTIADDTTYTSDTINHTHGGTFDDYFTFRTGQPLTEFTTGAFTEGARFGVSSATLTLYEGLVGSGTELVSSGAFDPMTQAAPTISWRLGEGDYYVLGTVTVPDGLRGAYTMTATTLTSAALEPATWALMLSGVAMLGGMLRSARTRRRKGDEAFA